VVSRHWTLDGFWLLRFLEILFWALSALICLFKLRLIDLFLSAANLIAAIFVVLHGLKLLKLSAESTVSNRHSLPLL
jgi:hypothetical protein